MAGEDPHYTDWVHRQPCHQCKRQAGCDAHHRTGAGMGLRSHDHASFPLCRWCHTAFHAGSGPFKWFDKAGRRDWQDKAVIKARGTYSRS